jgi:cytochrome c oxidase assembly protein subunit 11
MALVAHKALISRDRNRWAAYALTALVALMLGAAFAAVPLYTLFCQATGFGGTTQRAESNPKGVIDRAMTVRFDANVTGALPWSVEAAKPVTDQIGNTRTIVYTATNLSDRPVTGTAGFNVTPELAGGYFNKLECFCFTEQTLQPGESVEMPVVFFIDPDIDQDPDLGTVKEITLSYTFYASDSEGR